MSICHDNMTMTDSHSGILVNVNYQLNKSTTFIQTKYESSWIIYMNKEIINIKYK